MPRINLISSKDELPPDRHAEFDAIVAVLHGVRGPFGILMHSPGLAQKVMEAGAHVRLKSTLTPIERELTILAVAREKDATYEWASHVKTGRTAGLREQAIEAVRHRADVSSLEPDERDIITFVRQLLQKNRVEPAVFDALLGRHGERWLVELAGTVGQYQYISAINNTFDLQPAADADKLPVHPGVARQPGEDGDVTSAAPTPRFPEPHEIDGYWDWDKIHAPKPLTPLAGDAIVMTMGDGFTIAQHAFGSKLELISRMVNYYLYSSFRPDPTFDPPTNNLEDYTRELERLAFNTGERWINEWEPSLIPILQKARTEDYASMSDGQLQVALDEQLGHLVYYWTIHGWINLSLVPATALTDFYNAEINPDDPNEAWQLTQGYRTRSVDASKGLWRLSRIVKASPALQHIFETMQPREMVDALEGTDEGRAFLVQLRGFLDEFGWRSDGIYEIGAATWREDPTIPLNTIQGYLRLSEDHNPDLALDGASQRREALVAAAKAKLAPDPAKVQRFDELMEAARHNMRIVEDHSYWIDQMGIAAFRRFCLAIGQRLVDRGLLADAEDVFFLFRDELRDVLAHGGDRKAITSQRRAEMQAAAAIVPPFHLGEPTPNNDDPFFIAVVDKMLGLLPVEPSVDPDVITGVAASAGTVRGPAKVVKSLVEASKLQAGDIMVCEMTVPTWVPLFATVSGIVADSGGILSHCAIVAREFHLPAVVGTRVGTEVIKDGMTITVDGTKGLVRIESRP